MKKAAKIVAQPWELGYTQTKKGMKVIVSENATEYFKKEGITSSEWVEYCREKFGLKNGDVVFYEGNTIGYIKIQNENIRKH